MDIFDWYFKQIVTQSQMDWAFDRVQDSVHAASLDNEFVGIVRGMDPQQHAPTPDKNIDIVGPGTAYDPEGQRCHVADLLSVVDCSQDEFGTDSNPPTPLFERYISVFIRFKRDFTEPALDGNNVVIYTKQLESFEFFVRLGAEAAAGTAIPAPLMADAVLVCDILIANGFTAILNADFNLTRREDWVRFSGATIGDRVYGTSQDAVEDLLALVDAWASALPFSFTSTWFGPAAVAGPTPPPTTIQESLNAIVYDLAQTGAGPSGSDYLGVTDSGVFPLGFVTPWVSANLQAALMSLGTDLDAHIGGAPPAHPASTITFAPYLYLAATDVQAAIQELVDDLANATATGGATRIGNDAYLWIGSTTLRAQIREIVDDLAAQGVGVSGAKRIGMETIAGVPESSGVSTVDVLLTSLFGHVNARTERALAESITGPWSFDFSSYSIGSQERVDFKKPLRSETIIRGGCGHLFPNLVQLAAGSMIEGTDSIGWMYGVNLGSQPSDLCRSSRPLTAAPHGEAREKATMLLVFRDLAAVVEADLDCRLFMYPGTYTVRSLAGVPLRPVAICSNATHAFILGEDSITPTQSLLTCYDLATWSNVWTRTILKDVGNSTARRQFTRMEYYNNGVDEGPLMNFAGEGTANNPLVFVRADNSAMTSGRGNLPSDASYFISCFWQEPVTNEVLLGYADGITPLIGSAAMPSCGAGSYGTYGSGFSAPYDMQGDGDNVWWITDGPLANTFSLNVWNFDGAIDSDRVSLNVLQFLDMNDAVGMRMCFDGQKIWVNGVQEGAVPIVNPDRRAFVQSFYPDSLREYIGVTGNMALNPNRHFTKSPLAAIGFAAGIVGNIMCHAGYCYSINNFEDGTDGEIVRTVVSPYKE